ncbi:MAG: DUF2207 domain-containing protein, partial [Streptosporangiaceae bacterium]
MLGRMRLIAVPLVLLAFASPAQAATGSDRAQRIAEAAEKVVSDQVALTLTRDGVTHAQETISYDFGSDGGDGFDRVFVTKIQDSGDRDRVFRVQNVRATAPYEIASTSVDGDRTVVRVRGKRAAGVQTVALTYDVLGAVADQERGQEFRWTAVGGWDVPVVEAKVTAGTGMPLRNVNCFTGSLGSVIGCSQFFTDAAHLQATFNQQAMLPQEYLTVVTGLPAGTAGAMPIYAKRKTLASAFSVNPVTGGALGVLLLVLLGGFGLLYLVRGRDKRASAAAGTASPISAGGFEPPDGVRPGQIGTLIDEQADVIDVTGSIVDLAVRGYLLVEEEEGKSDWTLRKLPRPVNDLLPYEQLLFDGLFAGRDTVRLSELGGTFTGRLAAVRAALYEDMVTQGWFARRPDAVRSRWTLAGIVLAVAGVVGTAALAILTELGLVGLAVIAFGLALTYAGKHMPARTARGSTVLAHTLAFQAYL